MQLIFRMWYHEMSAGYESGCVQKRVGSIHVGHGDQWLLVFMGVWLPQKTMSWETSGPPCAISCPLWKQTVGLDGTGVQSSSIRFMSLCNRTLQSIGKQFCQYKKFYKNKMSYIILQV